MITRNVGVQVVLTRELFATLPDPSSYVESYLRDAAQYIADEYYADLVGVLTIRQQEDFKMNSIMYIGSTTMLVPEEVGCDV